MSSEIVSKFKIIIDDKGYESEENHVIVKSLLATIIKRKSSSFVRSRIQKWLKKRIELKIIAYNIRRSIVINIRFSTRLVLLESLLATKINIK